MLATLLFWLMALGVLGAALMIARAFSAPASSPPAVKDATAIIIPCKGVDPHFPAFLEAVAGQTLGSYHLYFTVASPKDEVASLIQAFLDEHPGLGSLVIFPPPPGYWGKVANMLGGMKAAIADGATYLVFLDSDTVPAPSFAAHLLRPLWRDGAMLSTGARVLAPASHSLPEWVAALWLTASLLGVAYPQQGSAWGGAMALRAKDARRLDVEAVWREAFSDDATLSHAVRQAGGALAFAPDCLVVNPIHYDWPALFDFLNRQLLTIRVHDPRLWYAAWLMALPCLSLPAAAIQWLAGAPGEALLTLSSLLPVVFAFYLGNEAVWRRCGRPDIHFRRRPLWQQIAVFLALLFVHPLALMMSASTRHFHWRGQRYEVRTGRIRWLGEEQIP